MATTEIRTKYKLGPIESYHYLNQSGVYKVNDVDDAEDFRLTVKCM
jgi:myosin heavy subunit